MRVLIIGFLAGELGQAARIAVARGVRLDHADEPVAALARLRSDARLDLVLCDVAHDLGPSSTRSRQSASPYRVVACGSGSDPEIAAQAIRDGAREFLPLPPDPELIAAILEAAAGESHTMVVRDPAMIATIRRAAQVAASEASVLIAGEFGTGKEVLAGISTAALAGESAFCGPLTARRSPRICSNWNYLVTKRVPSAGVMSPAE